MIMKTKFWRKLRKNLIKNPMSFLKRVNITLKRRNMRMLSISFLTRANIMSPSMNFQRTSGRLITMERRGSVSMIE